MARPRNSAAVDLSFAHDLTAGLIDRLRCPDGKAQAFLRDVKSPGLRVRVTSTGAKSYVFEAKLDRDTIRRTIGDVRSWSIEEARAEANRLRVLVDTGVDPRERERQQQEDRASQKAADAANAVTVGEAWTTYIEARRERWSERHYQDHLAKAKAGGAPAKRGTPMLDRDDDAAILQHYVKQCLSWSGRLDREWVERSALRGNDLCSLSELRAVRQQNRR